MEFTTFIWTTIASFLTLCTFSFLYKDNPFYKIAEHIVVGTSAGYFVIILWHNGLVTNLFNRIEAGDWWYFIPGLLGIMMFTRFSRKSAWISRWPLALYIGIATGLSVPLEMTNRVIRQVEGLMVPIDWGSFFGHGYLDIGAGYSGVIVFVGTLCALVYFFFSKAHTGLVGGVAKVGIWTLMIGFGASFGYTVMARISLFINRIQDLDERWIAIATDTSNPNYHAGFPILFGAVLLIIVIYIARELFIHLSGKGGGPQMPQ